jgi:LSD1 subclass zinc finger protein
VTTATFTWRCRFCRTLLALARAAAGSVITCPQCQQQTAIAREAA